MVAGVEEDLNSINALLDQNVEFSHFLLAPYTGREEKGLILGRLFSDRITSLTMQVLRVMLEKRREGEIPAVRSEYIRLRREHERVEHIVVTSAEPMDAAQRDALIARMASLLNKRVESDFQVDPTLIGGVRVAYSNFVLDGSARGALNKLGERLKYDLLKRLG